MLYPSPFTQARTVTPGDTAADNFDVNLKGGLCDALQVGNAAAVTVVFQDGSTAAFTCVVGQILPVKVKRVNATGTAATLIVALYAV